MGTAEGFSATSTSMPAAGTICSAGSVLKFSIAAVTLELESADVPEAGENVSSFSVPAVPDATAVALAPSFGAGVADDAAAVMATFYILGYGWHISLDQSFAIFFKQWKKEQASRCCTAYVCLRQSVNKLYNNKKKWPNLVFFPLLDLYNGLRSTAALRRHNATLWRHKVSFGAHNFHCPSGRGAVISHYIVIGIFKQLHCFPTLKRTYPM